MPEDPTASSVGQEPTAAGDTASQALASTLPASAASAASADAAPSAASQTDVSAQADAANALGATDATTTAPPTAPNAKPAMSLEDALAALRKAREEAAGYRVKAKELDALKQEIADAKLTAEQRLQKQLAEAQAERDRTNTQAQERVVRAEIRSTARELGLKPELALRLLDYAALTYDDDGDPTNVSDLLTQAAQDYGIPLASGPTAAPVAATSAPAPAPTPAAATPAAPVAPRPSAGQPVAPARSATQGAGGALTRALIESMSPREYAERRADVQAWLSTHPNG